MKWSLIYMHSPETLTAMNKIWLLRQEGLNVFFTQDAGPNLKLIFLEKERASVQEQFPDMEIVSPFAAH